MSLKWSFSSDRCFRRCQRQFFFRDIAAWHNAKEPLRHEAFVRKQLKSLELWRGLLVHLGIEKFVVPQLKQHQSINWKQVFDGTIAIAERQFKFSAGRRYRDRKLSKKKAGDDYCALLAHEFGETVSTDELEAVHGGIRRSFENLAGMDELWELIGGRQQYWVEIPIRVTYDDVRLEMWLDLLMGGSDANLQTALYGWAMCRNEKWHVQRADDIELVEVQLGTAELIRHRCDQSTFDDLEDRIFRSVDEMRALCGEGKYDELDINDFGYARNPNNCAYCPFRDICTEPQVSLQSELIQLALI